MLHESLKKLGVYINRLRYARLLITYLSVQKTNISDRMAINEINERSSQW